MMKDISLKLVFSTYEIYITFITIYHFHLKEGKMKKVEKLVTNLHDKAESVFHIRN